MNPEQEPNPKREITPWSMRPFGILVAGFFIFMAIMFIVLGQLTARWTHGTWPPYAPVQSVASTTGWNTNVPQLQADPSNDLSHWQKHEYQQLHTTEWTDNTHAYAIIPMERSMDLIVAADAEHRLDQILPPPKPATPLELQNQKSTEAAKAP